MKKGKLFLVSVAFVLALVFVLSGCTPGVAPTAAPTSNIPAIDPDQYEFPTLPEAGTYDFGGETFIVSSYHAQYEQREEFLRTYALVDEIMSRYNCTIEWIYPTRQAEIDASALTGHPIADMSNALMCHQFAPMIGSGIITPLDPYAEQIKFDDERWEPLTKPMFSINGSLYALSPRIQELYKFTGITPMFANKTLLEYAGVDIEDLYKKQENKEWTWEVFADAAGKVTRDINRDDIPDIYGCQATGTDWYTAFFVSAGTNIIKTDENGKMHFSYDQKVIDVLDFFKDLITSNASRPSVALGGMSDDATASFINGTLGFQVEQFQRTWQAGFLDSMTDEYGVLCVPLAPGQSDYYFNDKMYHGNIMYTNSDKEHLAKVADLFYLYGTNKFENAETEAECYWLEGENRIFDEGSRYFLERVYERQNVVVTRNVELWQNGFAFYPDAVLGGFETAKQYLDEVAPVMQSFLDEYHNYKS